MHSAGEKRGHQYKKYTAEALESIKQDLTRFQVQKDHGAQNYTQLRYNGGPPDYHHPKPPPLEPTTSASPSPGNVVQVSMPTSQLNGHVSKVMPVLVTTTKLNRKPSIERDVQRTYMRCSPALDSGAGSSRSDSPHSHQQLSCANRASTGQYSPSPSSFSDMQPPAPPPRNPTNPSSATPPPPLPSNQLLKRRSPATTRPAVMTPNSQRGTSPVIPVLNGVGVVGSNSGALKGPTQQQLLHGMTSLSIYQAPTAGVVEPPPPPYPLGTVVVSATQPPPPPSYTASMQQRQSPTQSQSDYRKSPSSGIYSATSAGSPSPITVTNSAILPSLQTTGGVTRPQPRPYQTRAQQTIIMQSVKSTHVQKPVLQNAVAPQSPVSASSALSNSPVHILSAPPSYPQKSVVQQQQQQSPLLANAVPPALPIVGVKPAPPTPTTTPPPLIANALNGTVVPKPPCIDPPSYAISMQVKQHQQHQQQQQQQQHQQQQQQQHHQQVQLRNVGAAAVLAAQQQQKQAKAAVNNPPVISNRQLPPPPPYQSARATPPQNLAIENNNNNGPIVMLDSKTNNNGGGVGGHHINLVNNNLVTTPPIPPAKNNSSNGTTSSSGSTGSGGASTTGAAVNTSGGGSGGGNVGNGKDKDCKKIEHASPIPERKKMSKETEEERKDNRIRQYSPQAYKFFMEQHVENVLKSSKQRMFRRNQLEREMMKIGLPKQTQNEMRKMLNQKESNYIRLKRAKMDKSMFVKIKPIGVGAFGEVTLVRKIDTSNHLYAMKTLRKADVLKRNQVAHVKAERDILAEADNNWVVKLYYSFQDKENLYFVMDYIPGGDLMSLLIKKGIFEEPLARFYIAELTCAVESVHKMGFIHRDIKPDNILIDRDGHIKLTDFGLCTGFRWTHNSKYYQENGNHSRQDSMEPWEDYSESGTRPTVLERRRMREHQRTLAHSLVGTPNYIAPEVLERSGYTQLCDWWSVGVILYEMLVGQPPFLANTAMETQQKVINWENTLHIPPQAKLSKDSSDLIRRLCSSSEKRLGKNADEVKAHGFFKGVDFADMRKQRAPYIPKIEYPTDTSNFDPIDPEKLRSNDANLSVDDLQDTDKQFHGFFEFTFRRFFDDRSLNPETDDQPVYV